MKTVYDIFVLNPTKTIVACTWRGDYVNAVWDRIAPDHCPDISSGWRGGAMWREIKTPEITNENI